MDINCENGTRQKSATVWEGTENESVICPLGDSTCWSDSVSESLVVFSVKDPEYFDWVGHSSRVVIANRQLITHCPKVQIP